MRAEVVVERCVDGGEDDEGMTMKMTESRAPRKDGMGQKYTRSVQAIPP